MHKNIKKGPSILHSVSPTAAQKIHLKDLQEGYESHSLSLWLFFQELLFRITLPLNTVIILADSTIVYHHIDGPNLHTFLSLPFQLPESSSMWQCSVTNRFM